jgi:hypothetical protein
MILIPMPGHLDQGSQGGSMSQQWFDPSSKWMLEEQGAGILYLARARSVVSCRARKAEVVQPRQLPDGLLEVTLADSATPELVVVEVATYPEKRVVQQVQDDIRLVRQVRGVLPEAVVLCLCPRGKYRVPQQAQEKSRLGWTGATLSWKVVEVWTLSAEELLAAPNIGVVPWVPLADYQGPPEVLLQRCRDRLEREGGTQKANLLAVTQVFASLHFDRPKWLDILGGRKVMIESPLIQEIVTESRLAESVDIMVHILQGKFGPVGSSIPAGLAQLKDKDKHKRLALEAATCASLQDFEKRLREELSMPAPASTRGKRRSRKSAE